MGRGGSAIGPAASDANRAADVRRAAALLIVAALAVAGCGGGTGQLVTSADTEGIYLDLGGMKYQVQISRLLNPTDREDEGYLVDLPAGQGSIQGALLLFKIPTRNLENRPLELSIRTPAEPGKTATVDLDV